MNKATRIFTTVALCLLVGLAAAVWFSSWSFRGQFLDAGVVASGLASFVALSFGISSIYPSVWSRLINWIVAGPILLVSIIGIPGVVGVLMAESDLQPKAVREIDSEHSYRWIVFGGCHGTCTGARLTLFYHPQNFPFIEKQIWESQYYAEQYDRNLLQVDKTVDGQAVRIVRRKRDGALEVTTIPLR